MADGRVLQLRKFTTIDITTGRTPSLAQLERQATQILAILMVGVKKPKPEGQHG